MTTRYFAGIDWSSQKHDLCIQDAAGKVHLRLLIPHTAGGLEQLLRTLQRYAGVQVAIERPSGLVVDTLLEAGIPVVPIHPNQLSATRSRYSAARPISDESDAYILSDLLRTDGHRFRVLCSASDETKALRALMRTRDDLMKTRGQICNQLHALLESFWPGPLGLFSELDNGISLAFLARYPTPQSAARMGERRLASFLAREGYCGRTSVSELLQRLRSAPLSAAGEEESRMKGELVKSLVAVLRSLKEEIRRIDQLAAEQLQAHPDAVWLRSFPCIGVTNAAQILSELGDERARYVSSQHLCAEGGVAPVTRGSGRKRAVVFRFACNKRLRKALTCWANNSRRESAWAEAVYRESIKRGCSHPHALRILARAWVRVLWRCWRDRAPYEPAKHGRAQALHSLPAAA
jgi:transposase